VTNRGTEVQLRCLTRSGSGTRRGHEPVTFGLPFPKGRVHDPGLVALRAEDGTLLPLQTEVLDKWSDGSIRWALLDFQHSYASSRDLYRVSVGVAVPGSPAGPPLTVTMSAGAALVDTGSARFRLLHDGRLSSSGPNGEDTRGDGRFRLIDQKGRAHAIKAPQISCEMDGPLRSVLVATGSTDVGGGSPLEITVRYHFYAGLPVVRIVVTLGNSARAVHKGGFWELGDPGSQYVRDFSYSVVAPPIVGARALLYSAEPETPFRSCDGAIALYQDSSGGENWNSPNHRNRSVTAPVRFKGYRLTAGAEELTGLRATPAITLRTAATTIALTHPRFWQRFPKTLSALEDTVRLGLLPQEFADVHELQGGEQITEEFVVAFGDDGVSETVLEWVRDPLRITAEPDWYCAAEAVPHLTAAGRDPNRSHESLINAAIEGSDAFTRKREQVDEYGWRNFGDLYADHEAVFHQGREIFVSHYNNQYDAIAGMAIQYFRSGDMRWLELLDDLARHVIDIDIYHTTEDKSAYNGGMFWHTAHHVNADISTHRTYPRSGGLSGGPAAEHNYNTGLMLYYFMTGDARAREAAVSLARWVIDMDDGEKTPFKWLSRSRTGVASATGSYSYHGPGRAPANSIVALLNGFRLTGDSVYLMKAEELIRRCSHPADDIEALNLLDVERRWFYTVYLQALARYLELKEERNAIDETYAYARAVLLHYAAWMVEHEYPYLEQPEKLEFPNETWAAQEIRKSEVFDYASRYAEGHERSRLLERSRYFFDYAVSTLQNMPRRTFTRPVVLMLTNGNVHHAFQQLQYAPPPAPPSTSDFGTPLRFVPQKAIAVRRFKILATLLVAAAIGIAAAMLR